MPYGLALGIAVFFVVLSQVKINVTNAYSGSLRWTNFFSTAFKWYPGRVYFVFFNVAIALVLMEANMFSFLNELLGFYSNVAIAWIGAVVADLVINKPLLKTSPSYIEFKRAHMPKFNPSASARWSWRRSSRSPRTSAPSARARRVVAVPRDHDRDGPLGRAVDRVRQPQRVHRPRADGAAGRALDRAGAVQRLHRALRDAGRRAVPVPQGADLLAVLHAGEVLQGRLQDRSAGLGADRHPAADGGGSVAPRTKAWGAALVRDVPRGGKIAAHAEAGSHSPMRLRGVNGIDGRRHGPIAGRGAGDGVLRRGRARRRRGPSGSRRCQLPGARRLHAPRAHRLVRMSGLPAQSTPILVAPSAFGGALRAPVVAAAIGRGLERAGAGPPDLCPLAGGGRGTIEVLLPVLGGETGDGFALIEDGGTALVELGADAAATGARIAAAVDAGAEVVLVCGGGAGEFDAGAGLIEAIEEGGGPRGAALVVLCETRGGWGAAPRSRLRRDPRGIPMTAAGGGLAGALWASYDAALVPGPAFVLEQLGFDARMRAARALVVGESCSIAERSRAASPARPRSARAKPACRATRSWRATRSTASTRASSTCRRSSRPARSPRSRTPASGSRRSCE